MKTCAPPQLAPPDAAIHTSAGPPVSDELGSSTHGVLTFREGSQSYRLEAGDCLQLGAPVECEFLNAGDEICRYVVGLVRR